MSIPELLLIAIGLSMDAFAVAVCAGLTMPKVTIMKSLIVGLYFGIFQAMMPLIGYLLATRLADKIIAYDHWLAFALLGFIGGKMIAGSFEQAGSNDRECTSESCPDRQSPGGKRENSEEMSLRPGKMLPLSLATSVDALAAGVSFAFLQVNIAPAVSSIGIVTLALSMAGVRIGNVFGMRFKSRAELAGGIILVLMGLKILLEHLKIINL